MSRSPGSPGRSSEVGPYLAGWEAIVRLIREGGSWSGAERNCVFLNGGSGRFADVSAASGLDLPDDGRAAGVVDWDGDGDLDLWLRNRTAPRLRLMRNEASAAGAASFVAFRLEGAGGNRDAIGARVEVVPAGAARGRLVRTLHAGDGFLSQSSKWLHFGLDRGVPVEEVSVRWPDGRSERFAGVEAGRRYRLVEGSGRAIAWTRPAPAEGLTPSEPRALEPAGAARIALPQRVDLPALPYETFDGATRWIEAERPLLVNLWASWCAPCVSELSDLAARAGHLRAAGLDVLALTVEAADEDDRTGPEDARRRLEAIGFPHAAGTATTELLEKIDVLQQALFVLRPPAVVPLSLLVDGEGRLAAIYRGPIGVEVLLADAAAVARPDLDPRAWAASLPGRRYADPLAADVFPRLLAGLLVDAYPADAERLLAKAVEHLRARRDAAPEAGRDAVDAALAETHRRLGAALERRAGTLRVRLDSGAGLGAALQGHRETRETLLEQALGHYRRAVELRPEDADARVGLALALQSRGLGEEAVVQYRAALRARPDAPATHYNLALALRDAGGTAAALGHFLEAARLDPGSPDALAEAAWILATDADPEVRDATRAVQLAERAAALAGGPEAAVLDALAAAYAAAGRFEEAVASATRAAEAAGAGGDADLASFIRERLALYRSGRAYREGAAAP